MSKRHALTRPGTARRNRYGQLTRQFRSLLVENLENRCLLSAVVEGDISSVKAESGTPLAAPGDASQFAEINASDGAAYAEFGSSVAISGDTMVIGAPNATVGGNAGEGAVYVLTVSGSTWTQTAELTPTGGVANDFFGHSVAVSGGTIVVGAEGIGVYVFTQSGSTWTQTAELTPTGGPKGFFGESAAISGGTIVVGADGAKVGDNSGEGAAYVFTETGSVWTQTAELTPIGGSADEGFGNTVAISDGTIVVGAGNATVGSNNDEGTAYVFTESGSTWTQTAELALTSGTADEFFGGAVAISGSTIVVGAGNATVGSNNDEGTAYVFTESGSTWTQTAELALTSGTADEFFGGAVAISGSTIVVGADGANNAAYIFTASGSTWTQTAELTPDAAGYDFAFSVAIGGSMVVVGAPNAPVGSSEYEGAAYVFEAPALEAPPSVTGVSPAAGLAAGGTTVTITGTGFTGASQVDFGSTPAATFIVNSDDQITATSPAGIDAVAITVVTAGGVSTAAYSNQFTYLVPPTVTYLDTQDGALGGGTTITIGGTNLIGATAVLFGSTAGTIVSNNGSQIVAVSPPEGAGTVDVTVVTPGGVSATSSADTFTYTSLAITSANSALFRVDAAGSFRVTAGGADATFSYSGTLPPGVSFNASGVLSGTPAAGTVGLYPIIITASYGTTTNVSQSFTLKVGTQAGAVYWLSNPATGGWLEMQAAGSDQTQLLDTNVTKFAIDGSNSVIALEEGGAIVQFAPNSTVRRALQPTVQNGVFTDFAIDAAGEVVAFEPTVGSTAGILVWFAPGSTTWEKGEGSWTRFAVDGVGDVVALDTRANLWLYANDASWQLMAANVSTFLVDGSGSVVAFQPHIAPDGEAGPLVRFAPGSAAPEAMTGSYTDFALDGAGDVVALDTNQNLVYFPPGADSTAPVKVSTKVATFLIDRAGVVWAFQQTQASGAGSLTWFQPRFAAPVTILDSFTEVALDGSGEVVALNTTGTLELYSPITVVAQPGVTGGTSELPGPMAGGVSSFVVDGAGDVVADALLSLIGKLTTQLLQFRPGSNDGVSFERNVAQVAIDGTGAVVARDFSDELVRFAPGSTQPQSMDANAVQSFGVDGSGQVVALEGDGSLVRFVPGSTPGTFVRTVMIAGSAGGTAVQSLHIAPNGFVVAEVHHPNAPDPYAPYTLDYFAAGQTSGFYFTFDFVSSFNGDPANSQAQYVSNVLVLANGLMLVEIEADSQGNYGHDDYEVFQVDPTAAGFEESQQIILYVGNVTLSNYNSDPTITINQQIVQDYQWSGSIFGAATPVVEDIFLLGAGVAISILSAGTLAPAVAGVVADLGIGSGVVATAIGAGAAAAVADAATQGLDLVVTGHGTFNWSQLLSSVLPAINGSGLVGDLSSLGSLLDGADNSVVASVLDGAISDSATSFITALAKGGALSSALGQTAEAALGSLGGTVLEELDSSLISSTFLQDTASFLNQVSSDVSDLPFVDSALSFLTQASSPSAFADSAASFLDQIAAAGLGDTSFGANVASLLTQAVASGLTANSFTDGALTFLENAVPAGLVSSDLVQNLGAFLGQVGQSVFGDLANSDFGKGLGTFLQQAVAGSLTTSTLAEGLGTFLEQAVRQDPSLDTSKLAEGLGTFLQQAVGGELGLDTSTLAQGLGTFLQQAIGPNLSLDTSALAQGLGTYLQQAIGAQPTLDTSALALGLGDFLQQAQALGLNLDTAPLAQGLGTFLQQAQSLNFDTSPLAQGVGDFLQQAESSGLNLATSVLAQGLGDFLQQAQAVGLDLVNSPLAQGVGDFFQQAQALGLNLDTAPLAQGLGTFLQQAQSLNFDTSPLAQGVGDFLQQAKMEGLDLLHSAVAGNVGTLLQELAQAGNSVANSPFGQALGLFLTESAQEGGNFLESSFVQDSSSFLDQVLAGNLTGSTLAQDCLSYVNQTISDAAVDSNFAKDALPFLDQAVAVGFAGSTFAQDVSGLVSQLISDGFTDAQDELPGVNVTNAALLTALGNACISQGYTSAGTAALQLSAQIDNVGISPSVTGMSPAAGPLGGGTTVTITGSGFTGATAVDFGTVAATNVAVVSDTEITATSPAGAGTVDVTVVTPIGKSYIATIDQFSYVPPNELVTSDGAAGDEFGGSAAVSGKTMVGGSPSATIGGNSHEGAVYVFTQAGSTWMQTAELTPAGGKANEFFGRSVAISGGTIVVGAVGAVYVFTESGSTWTQAAELTSTGGPNGSFGNSVAISGGMIVVGAFGSTVSGNTDEGAAYVFTESGSTWTQTAELTPAGGTANDYFGGSVAIDGQTVVAGAQNAAVSGNAGEGAVYVFTQSGSTWTQTAELTRTGGVADDAFGSSVAISDGTIAIGAPDGNATEGAIDVFTRSGSTWTQTAELTQPDAAFNLYFGDSVAIDGETVVAGAYSAAVGGNAGEGAAYVFTGSGTTWIQAQTLTASNGAAGDWFGSSVAISAGTVLVGAPGDPMGSNEHKGAAYVFEAPPSVSDVSPASGSPAGGTAVTLTGSGFTGATAVDFGTVAATNVVVVSDTEITATSPAGTGTVNVTVVTRAGTSSASAADKFTYATQSGLKVTTVSPSVNFLTTLPNNEVVVTFNHWLAGLVPDVADGTGFTSNPYCVMLIPSGPNGAEQLAQTRTYWSAAYGVDGGDLPLPDILVYHQNADGTSTITLTPSEPLSTDLYLIEVGNLVDQAGNRLTGTDGTAGDSFFASFDDRPTPVNSSPLHVTGVTADNGSVVINNDLIAQPDTIGIRFNKPLDTWTANTGTIGLYYATAPRVYAQVPSVVTYSPTTDTAYLTPEATLSPGIVYVLSVSAGVSDDQQFPQPGVTLGQPYYTSFEVSQPGVGQGAGPLAVRGMMPADGTLTTAPLGYVSVTFSEPINLTSLGRYSAMLISHTGGVSPGNSGNADIPLNAKLAFNPNTNQLIIVPTGLLRNDTIYLVSLHSIEATNGDALAGSVYGTFLLNASAMPQVAVRATVNANETVLTPSAPVSALGATKVVAISHNVSQTARRGGSAPSAVRPQRVAAGPRISILSATRSTLPCGPLTLTEWWPRRGRLS